jgi:hypothetical protein
MKNNVDINKVKAKTRVQYFYYIAIWSCMLLKDVMQVFLLLIPQIFTNQFVFIQGCKQCAKDFWSTHYMNILLS